MKPATSIAQPSSSSAAAAPSRLSTHALLLTIGMLVAGMYAFAKAAVADGVPPLGVLSWQVLFAALVIGGVAAFRGELPTPTRTNLRYAGIAGVLGISAPNLFTFAALAHLPAGLVGVIAALSPMLTYTIALALRVEAITPLRAAGVALGLAGVMAIVLPRGALPSAEALPWALAALAAPLLHAGGNVFRSLAWPAGLKPLSAASLLLALQALVLVPLALARGEFEAPGHALGAGDVALLGAGAMTAALYLGSFELQKRAGPVGVGQLGYVVTVASLAIGAIVFGESYPLSTFAAVGVVLAGVALVNRRPPANQPGRQPDVSPAAADSLRAATTGERAQPADRRCPAGARPACAMPALSGAAA